MRAEVVRGREPLRSGSGAQSSRLFPVNAELGTRRSESIEDGSSPSRGAVQVYLGNTSVGWHLLLSVMALACWRAVAPCLRPATNATNAREALLSAPARAANPVAATRTTGALPTARPRPHNKTARHATPRYPRHTSISSPEACMQGV